MTTGVVYNGLRRPRYILYPAHMSIGPGERGIMKKKLAMLLVAVMAAGALAGCGGGKAKENGEKKENAKTEASVAPDNDMVICLQADATHLDPHASSNGFSNIVTNSMYETLLTFDKDLKIQPLLAESWEMGDDGLSYTFKLREGVKFQDGEPFNAEAVVENWKRGKSDEKLRLSNAVKTWANVTADSEYQVTITLDKPNNTFINKVTQVRMVSPKAIKELGSDGLAKQSAGTGPFKLAERVDGGYTKVVPNEEYWGEKSTLDSLTFQVVPEDGARIAMLQTGEADVIFPLPPVQVEKVKDDPNVQVINLDGLTYRYATLNQNYTLEDGRQPLKDVKVRQALNYAFDSNAYCQVVFQGFAKEPTSVFSEAVPYYAAQTPYTADVDKAKELMKEAGYESGFPITIWVDNTTIEMQGADFLKQQLAQINVDVNVQAMESTTIADMTSAPENETKVEMWYVNWSAGSYDADGSMRNILHGDKFPPAGYNTAFYNNAEFNEALDKALVSTDEKEVTDSYAKAQEIAWHDCPWIFLGVDNTIVGQKPYVTGVETLPGGNLVVTHAGFAR